MQPIDVHQGSKWKFLLPFIFKGSELLKSFGKITKIKSTWSSWLVAQLSL